MAYLTVEMLAGVRSRSRNHQFDELDPKARGGVIKLVTHIYTSVLLLMCHGVIVDYEAPDQLCCNRKCCINTSPASVNQLREKLWSTDYEKDVIKEMIKQARQEELLQPDGRPCCVAFGNKAANISNNFLYAESKRTAGVAQATCSRADVSIMTWLKTLLPIADKMPDEKWSLLSASTKKTVHEWYLDDCRLFPTIFVPCQAEWFCKVWREKYGDKLKLRKHCKFTKCNLCIEQRGIKNNRKLTIGLRLEARKRLERHYAQVKVERELALTKAFDAVRLPTEFLSICQDGTNQLPFGFPNFREVDKEISKHRMKTHLMISIVHGRDCYVYVTPESRVAGDPNLTIESLMRTLQSVEEADGYLPPVLYLQLDNCFRENKNSYLVAMLTWLVERKVFKHIELSFLPVGHTHNEADQCASCFSVGCRNNDIACLDDLQDILKKSYWPSPIVSYVPEVQTETNDVSESLYMYL